MPGILNIAYSGLNAFQNAISVTANNIANANSRGYTRQSIILQSHLTQKYGGSYLGNGVTVGSIYRNVDQFANAQVRSMETLKSQYDNFYQQALQIDKLLSNDNSSISVSLQSFFKAIGQVNDSPDSLTARDVFIKQSQLLAGQFNSLQRQLDEYQSNNNLQLLEAVNQINSITADLAAVNGQLMSTPNDPALLDLRDELLRQLAEFSEITVANQADGSVSVGLASGEMLIAGSDVRSLSISSNLSNTTGTSISLGTGAGTIDVTSRLTTGKLGALFDYQNTVITKASQLIGQMAIGLSQTFNAQHQLGMDMNSNIGLNFFTDYNSTALQLGRAVNSGKNTGTGVLSVNISNIGQTQLSDYSLSVTNAATNQLMVTRQSDGQTTVLTWSQNPPSPPAGQVVLDGMTITVDDISELADNDNFTLMPTRGAARDLAIQITDPKQVALASPVRIMSGTANTGQGNIALGALLNTNGVNHQYSIDFIDSTHFNLVDVTGGTSTGPFPFTPNSKNTIQIPDNINPSYSIVLSGAPNAGDQFSAQYNTGGIGDNTNGLLLGALQQSKILSGGNATLFDTYSSLISQVGSQTNQAKLRSDSADVLYQQAVDFQESKSKVNLDEEGVNLLRFQQAYEAAGKLLQVTSEIMNVLFDAMR